MKDEEGLIQNLRDFTVQILHGMTDTIVGTGVVVSDNKIVTCAHVLSAARRGYTDISAMRGFWGQLWRSLGLRKTSTIDTANRAEVGVYFPQARTEDAKK